MVKMVNFMLCVYIFLFLFLFLVVALELSRTKEDCNTSAQLPRSDHLEERLVSLPERNLNGPREGPAPALEESSSGSVAYMPTKRILKSCESSYTPLSWHLKCFIKVLIAARDVIFSIF